MTSRALGHEYLGDMFTGGATTNLLGGHIFHFNLSKNRKRIAVDDARLKDGVADNLAKYDVTESESLVFGRNFEVGDRHSDGSQRQALRGVAEKRCDLRDLQTALSRVTRQ
jgi:hypothetical protein